MSSKIDIQKQGNWSVVKVIGDMTISVLPELRKEFFRLFENSEYRLIINFEYVNYIDSSGIGLLIELLKKTSENGGELALTNLNPHCMKVFVITRLDKILKIYPDVQNIIKTS